jgi:hypothetical protein
MKNSLMSSLKMILILAALTCGSSALAESILDGRDVRPIRQYVISQLKDSQSALFKRYVKGDKAESLKVLKEILKKPDLVEVMVVGLQSETDGSYENVQNVTLWNSYVVSIPAPYYEAGGSTLHTGDTRFLFVVGVTEQYDFDFETDKISNHKKEIKVNKFLNPF